MKYILYNPKANNGQKPDYLEGVEYIEVLGLDYADFFKKLNPEDEVTFVGGDGTLNYFINAVDTDTITNNVYLRTSGSGNDFMNDIDNTDRSEVLLNPYIKNLPTVYVNGMEKKFINGIGYGIDGYCCEEGDKIREAEPGKQIDYTGIAIKGLLFHFKPKTAVVTVDGKEYTFKNAWLSPTMKGRFYGGGMMVAPDQNRLSEDGLLTTVVYHTWSKLYALINFPDIFKGIHIKNTKLVSVMTGKEVEVKFDVPCALQIDGETVLNVSSYKVKA